MQTGGSRSTGKLLMDRSSPGRMGVVPPPLDVPAQEMPDQALLRGNLDLPEVSEPEVVQYFTNLSQQNFSIDTQFYPLGSCTMKYNPKINDEVSFLPGFAGIHPRQPVETCQGALEVLHIRYAGGEPGNAGRGPGRVGRRADDARLSQV